MFKHTEKLWKKKWL